MAMTDAPARLYIDGAARGNPGPAAYAVILEQPGQPPLRQAGVIGTATNNVAEYTALLQGLRLAAQQQIRHLEVFSDSELLVKQMQGQYRVRHPELQRLYQAVQQLIPRFEHVHFTHVRREQNVAADQLVNAALDGQLPPSVIVHPPELSLPEEAPLFTAAALADTPAVPGRPATSAPSDLSQLESQMRAILQHAAEVWSSQGMAALSVEQVWQQMQAVLAGYHVPPPPSASGTGA
ncbi:MAG: ribonuclease HI family protein [Gemmataceae bacterium]|nr:ribonuclease HI family protein [Gemmataceae bacterium]